MVGKVKGKSIKGRAYVPDAIYGKSAYEIALQNGFEGTEEEWLASLKGEKGERGEGAVYYKYDFNGDGEVNEEDVHRLLYYVNFSQAPEYRPSWWSDPDVNGDGVVGDEDVATLKNWLETGNEAAYAIAPKNELVDDHFSATSEKPIRNKAVSAGAANALKGTASGTVVSITDVSPLEHPIGVKLSSDTATAFSSVTLKKYGKNLIDLSQIANETDVKYAPLVDNGDGTFTLTKVGARWQTKTVPVYVPKNTPFTISAKIVNQSKQFSVGIVRTDDWWGRVPNKTLTEPYDLVGVFLYFQQGDADGTYCTFADFQIEIGTATEYEPYKKPETVPVKQDGTASIIGKGEGITLMTDTEGVTITAEYNKDTNKVIESLVNAIISLGGNV